MASLETFDKEVKELVTSGKLSSSKVKSITDAAMANIASDAHLVATLFKVHKQAKSSHKISSLYVIDAIAREARQQVKKAAKGRQSSSNTGTPLEDGTGNSVDDDNDEPVLGKRSTKGSYASFLSKIESFLDRLVTEVLTKGPPEHKDKVKKVLDIWKKSATFSPEALKPCYARLEGETSVADPKTHKSHSHRSTTVTTGQRSTTPPYPPPEKPIRFPSFPPSLQALLPGSSLRSQNGTPSLFNAGQDPAQSNNLAALLGSISASQIAPPTLAAPVHQNLPSFEISQLALLQQLAAQSSVPAPFGAPSTSTAVPVGAPPIPPPNFPMPPQMSVPIPQPTFNSAAPPHHTQAATNNGWGSNSRTSQQHDRQASPPREARERRSQWDRDARPQARGSQDGRSVSPATERYGQRRQRSPPPPRQRSPPYREERQDSWGGSAQEDKRSTFNRNERAPNRGQPPRQQETRQIATYISEERSDDRASGKGKETRRGADEEDYSSFEVVPSMQNSGQIQQNATFTSSNMPPQQSEEEKAAQELMSNAPVFNPMTFNAMDPQSWAGFAHMCSSSMGRMPSTMEMMQWIMGSMAMMQSQMSGGMMMAGGMQGNMQGDTSMQGQMGMQGMMQQDFSSFAGNQATGMGMMGMGTMNHNESWDSQGDQSGPGSREGAAVGPAKQQDREDSIPPDTRPPPPTRDSGEGEADMQTTLE